MTGNTNALALRNTSSQTMDIEAQKPEAPQYNRNLARAKIATLAVASLAGAFTTALIALHEGSDPLLEHDGRALLKNDCSQHQLDKISKAKRALMICGITTGAGAVGFVGGTFLQKMGLEVWNCPGGESPAAAIQRVSGWIRDLGSIGFSLGIPATIVAGSVYGAFKGKC